MNKNNYFIGALTLMALYVVSYYVLCINEHMKPGCMGINGIKWWEGKPLFVKHDRQSLRTFAGVYFPVIYIDLILFDDEWYRENTSFTDYIPK